MATHDLGKSKDEKYWFKSTQGLTDVTRMDYFHTKKEVSWFSVTHEVYGMNSDYPHSTERFLGSYKTEEEASDALAVLMKIREIEIVGF